LLPYIGRRLLYALFVLLGVSTIIFFILRLTGDPVLLMVPPEATAADVERMRHLLGFDRPVAVQYVTFLADLARGDLGVSLRYSQPVAGLVLERLPATGQLAMTAFLFSLLISIPTGIMSAVRRGSWADSLGSVFALVGQATPVFWLGIMAILLFSVKLHWLPSQGRAGWTSLVMPAASLGLTAAAMTTRMMRSAMLEVLTQDFIRTARAKGLSERVVIYKHALKNALIPVITVLGLQFGGLLSGSVVTETVFAWPGVGRLVIQSITGRDFPMVQAVVLMISFIFLAVNLLVDIAYGWVNPRIRYD
jgi:peptide/nickel transport system permease protein